MKNEFIEYELVLETHNPGDIAFIKSILSAEKIQYYIQNESVAPYLFNALPMRLLVKKDHVAKTKDILMDVKLSFTYNLDSNGKKDQT